MRAGQRLATRRMLHVLVACDVAEHSVHRVLCAMGSASNMASSHGKCVSEESRVLHRGMFCQCVLER